MPTLTLLASQVLLVVATTIFYRADRRYLGAASRLLAAAVVALVIPPVLTSWLLMIDLPVSVGAIVSAVVLVALASMWMRCQRRQGDPSWSVAPLPWGLAVPLLLPFLVQVIGASLKPEASSDGLLYHGPALANIMSKGSLFHWDSANQYVYYSDLQMVLNALWQGDHRMVTLEDAVQAPFIPLAIVAIYVASQQTTRNRYLRFWLALVAVLAPVIWAQGRVLYVDVAAGALLASGVALAVAARRQNHMLLAVVAGLCFGASVATKPSALFAGFVGLVILLGLLMAWREWRLLLLTVAIFCVAGAPFYLRNWISFNNPFFPISAQVGPFAFPGVVSHDLFYSGNNGTGLVDPFRLYFFAKNLWVGMKLGSPRWLYDPREGGFGRTPLFLLAVFLIYLGILAVVVVMRRRSSGDQRAFIRPDLMAAMILVFAGAAIFVQPNPSDSRYVIGPYLMLAGFGIGLISLVPEVRWAEIALSSLVALVATIGVVRHETHMLFGIRESLSLGRTVPTYNTGVDGSTLVYDEAFAWMRGSTCARILAQTFGGLGPQGMPPEGLMTTYQYGLWGDQLCNEVQFVSIPDPSNPSAVITSDAMPALLTGMDFLVVDERSQAAWEAELEQLGIPDLQVYSLPPSQWFPTGQSVLELDG